MPQVLQIMETALYVADLDRAERFYRGLFGFPTIFSVPPLRVLSVHDRQVLLLFLRGSTTDGAQTPAGFIPGHSASGPQHLAFGISANEIEPWCKTLTDKHVAIESQTGGPLGGYAIYFRDPDEHLIELATPAVWNFAT